MSMNRGWLAWGLLVIYGVLVISGLVLQVVTGASFGEMGIPVFALFLFYGILGFLIAIGVLIVSRHPRHPVGWAFSVGLVTPSIDQFAAGYVAYSLTAAPVPLAGASVGLLWLNWSGMPIGIMLFTLCFLLSPDGKFLSPGWRRWAWFSPVSLAGYLALKSLEPGPVVLMPTVHNPFGAGAGAWALLQPVMWFAFGALCLCYLAGIASLILRMRRRPVEQGQQIRWLIPPGLLFLAGVPLLLLGEYGPNRGFYNLGGMIHMVAVSSLVLAVAFGVFKYSLYDLHIAIRRTLVYSLLTGALGLVYFSSVAVLQAIFPAGSQLTTVISTLAIAALFSPLRRRIQGAIDKRFFRRKYDAALILASFGAEVRDQVDLDRLTQSLTQTVEEALQPSDLSLWLRQRDG